MLVDFQIALADLTASPALCREVRRAPETLRERYELTDKEWRRLVGIARSKGMEANCMLYRANRLAPVALNLPDLCEALRDDLKRLLSAYWESEPTTDVHFLVEADRFCRFLQDQPTLSRSARDILEREHAVVAAKLTASRHMARTRRESELEEDPPCPPSPAQPPTPTTRSPISPGRSIPRAFPVVSDSTSCASISTRRTP